MAEAGDVEVHPTAEVEAGATVGSGTKIWRHVHVMSGAVIGARCSLGQGCHVASGAVLGDGVRVQNHVSIYDGVTLGDDVFVGPSCVFTNVRQPRAHVSRRHLYGRTIVERGATLGANATILSGVVIGAYAFVGAGAVVTRDVPAHALVLGAPAQVDGWMSRHGERLAFDVAGFATCPATGERYRFEGGAVVLIEAGS